MVEICKSICRFFRNKSFSELANSYRYSFPNSFLGGSYFFLFFLYVRLRLLAHWLLTAPWWHFQIMSSGLFFKYLCIVKILLPSLSSSLSFKLSIFDNLSKLRTWEYGSISLSSFLSLLSLSGFSPATGSLFFRALGQHFMIVIFSFQFILKIDSWPRACDGSASWWSGQ